MIDNRVNLLVLQPTPGCNLDCDYCYLPKRHDFSKLTNQLACRVVEVLSNSQELLAPQITLAWHAGEPLIFGKELFRQVAEILNSIQGTVLRHAIQTNATLIDYEWAEIFKELDVSIGISIDGPPVLHDAHRKNLGGRGSAGKTLRGIEILRNHRIPFSTISVVTGDFLEAYVENVDFLLGLRARFYLF